MWRNKRAVSNVVGVVLLLLITIAVASTLYYTTLSYEMPEKAPIVSGLITHYSDGLHIEHWGGESILLKDITVSLRNDTNTIELYGEDDFTIKLSNNDDYWNVGEHLVYDTSSLNGSYKVNVVDNVSNSIILSGRV